MKSKTTKTIYVKYHVSGLNYYSKYNSWHTDYWVNRIVKDFSYATKEELKKLISISVFNYIIDENIKLDSNFNIVDGLKLLDFNDYKIKETTLITDEW